LTTHILIFYLDKVGSDIVLQKQDSLKDLVGGIFQSDLSFKIILLRKYIKLMGNKKAVLPQGNRAMPQVFCSVEVRQQHSLQV